MKRKIGILVLIGLMSITIFGCSKKGAGTSTGYWDDIISKDTEVLLSEEEKSIFDAAAKKDKDMEYEPIALLAKQVVAGTNYMFFTKSHSKGEKGNYLYKIVIVYNDLKNNSKITYKQDFETVRYVYEETYNPNDKKTGAWKVSLPKEDLTLGDKYQELYKNATNKLKGDEYYPIEVLAKQKNKGMNYAVLCYGKKEEDKKPGIYILTLTEKEDGTQKVTSSAYVDLTYYTEDKSK